ncbi:uncharacterized protein [Panulirus ornatus]|uniref:uncharacterized protein n=1 Tax=Panulirus ornatus TaxID=150431 RepID=UPI003A8A6232
MSTGEEGRSTSPSKSEAPDGGDEGGAADLEDAADLKSKNRATAPPTTDGPRQAPDLPVLLNRRSKVVNGSLNARDKPRNKGSRDIDRRVDESLPKDREGRNTDSGLGRASAEGVDSPTADDPSGRRRVWETESEVGARDGERGSRLGRTQAAKKEEMARLEKELEQELRYRTTLEQLYMVWRCLTSKDLDTIQWSVDVLQQSVEQLEQQLDHMNSGQEDDGECVCVFVSLVLGSILSLGVWSPDLDPARWQCGPTPLTMVLSLVGHFAVGSQFELLRMMKILERQRNNLYSDFRNKSWLLDNHSKEYYHLKELIRAYTVDLTMVNRSLEHLWRQRTVSHDPAFAGGSTPVTSPGGLKWRFALDAVRERSSGQSGIRPSHRILDPRKGPIRKTVGVRSLPRLDQEALDFYEERNLFAKARSRSRGRPRARAKSLDVKKNNTAAHDVVAPLSPMLRGGKVEEAPSLRSSSGVFDESYEASNEASTTASVELSSDKL